MEEVPGVSDRCSVVAVRAPRVDARRNEEAILHAAKQVFAELGVSAPAREITARAGVGLGTLYRRFPTRGDLVAAVFKREVDSCADAAAAFAEDLEPTDALIRWLMRYTDFLSTKRGLAAALHSGDPAFATLPEYFRKRFEPVLKSLLSQAARNGLVRTDIYAYDLLRAIGNLSAATGPDACSHVRRMVLLMTDGLFATHRPVEQAPSLAVIENGEC
jgi:AcrR family transcriptional regulator